MKRTLKLFTIISCMILLLMLTSCEVYTFKMSSDSSHEHSWRSATCDAPKTCAKCGETEGEALGHSLGKDDGDCTTAITCATCDLIMFEGNESHIGGAATCLSGRICDVCGIEYTGKKHDNHISHEYIYVAHEDGETHIRSHKCCQVVSDLGYFDVDGTFVVVDNQNEYIDSQTYVECIHGEEESICTICENDKGYEYDEQTNTYMVYLAKGLYVWNKATQIDASANLVLSANITLTGENNWTPIGNDGNYYIGTVDGNGYTISGLNIVTDSYAGFIGCLGAGGVVQNLTLQDVTVVGYRGVGAIVGVTGGDKVDTPTVILNCHVTGASSVAGADTVGGIAGYLKGSNPCYMIACTNEATVSATGVRVRGTEVGYGYGGLVGCVWRDGNFVTVVACANKGEVNTALLEEMHHIGGICGVAWLDSEIIASWTVDNLEYSYYGSEVADTEKNGIGDDEYVGTISESYYFADTSAVTDIEMDAMNEAINSYNETATIKCNYQWIIDENGYPTLVEVE